jgi:serine/threonine protein kinase
MGLLTEERLAASARTVRPDIDRKLSGVCGVELVGWSAESSWLESTGRVEEVGACLGTGGFSRTFACNIPELSDNEVAVKVYASDVMLSMKNRDAMLNLKHPNLACLLDIICHKPLCLAYPMYPGGNLKDFFDAQVVREAISWEVRLKPVIEVAQAVTYLHEHDVVHRDIAAENVFLTEQADLSSGYSELPSVVLGNIGFAWADDVPQPDFSHHSQTGSSPYYMAPEVIEAGYGPKADVFSLAILLHGVVTDSLPRVKVTFTAMRHMLKTVGGWRPNSDCASVSQALAEILEVAWAQDPEARMTSAQLVEDLERLGGPPL